MVRVVVASLFLVSLVSCAAFGAFGKLDAESQDDFRVCNQTISKAQCGSTTAEASAPGGQGIGLPMCMNPLIEEYAATTKSQRKAWLVRHGCPKDMVGQ
jgi:hypothetical protein